MSAILSTEIRSGMPAVRQKALVPYHEIFMILEDSEIHCLMKTKILYSIIYLITVINSSRKINLQKESKKNANSHITELLLPNRHNDFFRDPFGGRGNVDATKLRLGYRSIDNEDTAKMSSSAIDHAPCLFPISDIKTEESSFEENPISSPDLASEEEENLLIALCKQSLTSATELLADTCPGGFQNNFHHKWRYRNADENEGDLHVMPMKMKGIFRSI